MQIAGSKSHPEQVAGSIIAKMQEHHVKAPYAELARLAKRHKQTELAKIVRLECVCVCYSVAFCHCSSPYSYAAAITGDSC